MNTKTFKSQNLNIKMDTKEYYDKVRRQKEQREDYDYSNYEDNPKKPVSKDDPLLKKIKIEEN